MSEEMSTPQRNDPMVPDIGIIAETDDTLLVLGFSEIIEITIGNK